MLRHLLVGGALLTLAAPVRAQDPAPIASRGARVYKALPSLSADFDQLIEDRMLGPLRSRGRLLQSGNAHLTMRFSEPDGDMIVLDGTYAWI